MHYPICCLNGFSPFWQLFGWYKPCGRILTRRPLQINAAHQRRPRRLLRRPKGRKYSKLRRIVKENTLTLRKLSKDPIPIPSRMLYDQIQEALTFLRTRTDFQPATGIILGTGLSNLADDVEAVVEIPYSDIPRFGYTTVESHAGQLVLGHLQGHPVVVMAGRLHFYEGWTMQEATFPVRVLQALGIERLLITNASGGINPHLKGGDIVAVRDHINLLPENPLRGANDERLGVRFPDMSQPYDADLRQRVMAIAKRERMRVFEGVYSALQGPNLETPAEYAMLRRLGSDCTGMSSVPEVLVARHMNLPVLMLSLVTNVSFPPDAIRPTTVEDVIGLARAAEPRLSLLIQELLKELG